MNGFGPVLRSLSDRLDLPQPARSRVLIEVAADLADLEAAFLERGDSPEVARARAIERLDLSDDAIRELIRVHGSPLRRGLDRLGERGRRRWEKIAIAALLIFLLLGTRALLPSHRLVVDAGRGIWVVLAVAIPGLLLAISKAYLLWGRDEHDPPRLRRGLDTILALGGLTAATGFTLWWLGLREAARDSAVSPELAIAHLLDWLTRGSATVVLSLQLAILLGISWLVLAGRTARVERGEAELLLLEQAETTKGG
ncbi:MAG: hypothetical protein P8049_03360 [Gemmatimonadota bacterium]|jgi:hypothetical protein